MEAKLNKIVTLKELDSNFAAISNNSFFKKDSNNNAASLLSSNLMQSVQDQYNSSLKNSFVAKYAQIWLEKTRQRRQERS